MKPITVYYRGDQGPYLHPDPGGKWEERQGLLDEATGEVYVNQGIPLISNSERVQLVAKVRARLSQRERLALGLKG